MRVRYIHLPNVPPLIQHWQHARTTTSTTGYDVRMWLRRGR